jgi:hypothetical protein
MQEKSRAGTEDGCVTAATSSYRNLSGRRVASVEKSPVEHDAAHG